MRLMAQHSMSHKHRACYACWSARPAVVGGGGAVAVAQLPAAAPGLLWLPRPLALHGLRRACVPPGPYESPHRAPVHQLQALRG